MALGRGLGSPSPPKCNNPRFRKLAIGGVGVLLLASACFTVLATRQGSRRHHEFQQMATKGVEELFSGSFNHTMAPCTAKLSQRVLVDGDPCAAALEELASRLQLPLPSLRSRHREIR